MKVMKKMNFSTKFCKWIEMLHEGAQTKFLLKSLTEAIQVCFSNRQGDPLSMILYVIYIEPLLMFLQKSLKGLNVASFVQKEEAYCDDVNIVTGDDEDLIKVDTAIIKFEAVSGAILSRDKKCKILGWGWL